MRVERREHVSGWKHTRPSEQQESRACATATKHPAAEVSEDRLTEAGAAERFARLHGDDVRYDHRRGQWLMWEQHRWRRDDDAEITRLALEFARQWQREAVEIDRVEQREAVLKTALRLERRDASVSMLTFAHDLRPIADAGDRWDTDPNLLGVLNGVVDLRTGELRDGRRDDRISLAAGAIYDQDARSELWEDTLKSILVDEDLITFFQTAVGYSATGHTSLDKWFLGFGSGRNGKGTLAQPISTALGDYALELPAAVLDLRAERAPYELARLPGRRLAQSSESGNTIKLNHDRVKQLSGGDRMSAANKYERPFEFQPVSKLWLYCNKKPRVTDDSVAFWSRVHLIPFRVSFAGREDPALRPALTLDPLHQSAILAWIVRGAVRFAAQKGLGKTPDCVIEATAAYQHDQDIVGDFLDEACLIEPDGETQASALYSHYVKWCDRSQITQKERLSATSFGRIMTDRFRRKILDGIRFYVGITIVESCP